MQAQFQERGRTSLNRARRNYDRLAMDRNESYRNYFKIRAINELEE